MARYSGLFQHVEWQILVDSLGSHATSAGKYLLAVFRLVVPS